MDHWIACEVVWFYHGNDRIAYFLHFARSPMFRVQITGHTAHALYNNGVPKVI